MAERLQNAGVSWKCYQQADNYGTNVLEFFSQFINAPTTSSLYQNAFGVSTLINGQPASDPTMAFEEDCANGTLPTVSWLFPTSVASEHPSFLPAAGAQFVASKIEALAANEDLWNSTVFILNYDENDGFFDHVPPITPPTGTADEFVTLNSPGGTPGGGLNLGSGFRVPAIVVSPWTVGGYVCSDPLDHTSVLRFIERVDRHHRAQHQRLAPQYLRRLHRRLPADARGGAVHPCRHVRRPLRPSWPTRPSSRSCPCRPSPAWPRRPRCSSRVDDRPPAEERRRGQHAGSPAVLNRLCRSPRDAAADTGPPRRHPEREEIIGKALEKDVDLRYQTAADLRGDLKRLKHATPNPAAWPRMQPALPALELDLVWPRALM